MFRVYIKIIHLDLRLLCFAKQNGWDGENRLLLKIKVIAEGDFLDLRGMERLENQSTMMNKYYPVNLVLKDKKCLVAGAGKVAERKVRRLLECGAIVSVIGPEITPGLKKLAEKKRIVLKKRKAGLKDLKGAYLVISAASDRGLNSAVSSFCLKKGILINVVDSPFESNFILPSLLKKGDLTITISTDGISPALAKKIRQELEKTLGREYIGFLRIMKKARPLALKKIKAQESRTSFFQKALQPEIFELLRQNKQKEAKEKILKLLLGFVNNRRTKEHNV